MSAPVDVLRVLDEAARDVAIYLPSADDARHEELREARAAVAELIEACRERDLAKASYDGIPPGDARLSVSERWERLKAAHKRYAAAFARVGGA